MANPTTNLLIKKSILQSLEQCGGYPCPEGSLRSQVEIYVHGMTRAEFESCLRELDAQGFVNGVKPQLGGDTKWTITDKGRLARAEL
ncbi:MAG: hypothetical protein V1929_00245 [bacterium]